MFPKQLKYSGCVIKKTRVRKCVYILKVFASVQCMTVDFFVMSGAVWQVRSSDNAYARELEFLELRLTKFEVDFLNLVKPWAPELVVKCQLASKHRNAKVMKINSRPSAKCLRLKDAIVTLS